jgi:hypothetical protein
MLRQGISDNVPATSTAMSGAGTLVDPVVIAEAPSGQTNNNGFPTIIVSQASDFSSPRAIVPTEIYPFNLFSYPDHEDYEMYLSNEPEGKFLNQVLNALERHVSVLLTLSHPRS